MRGGGDTETPEAKAWHAALQALRGITTQQAPDALFGSRYAGFDHVFGPELQAAHAWITGLHDRFAGPAGARSSRTRRRMRCGR